MEGFLDTSYVGSQLLCARCHRVSCKRLSDSIHRVQRSSTMRRSTFLYELTRNFRCSRTAVFTTIAYTGNRNTSAEHVPQLPSLRFSLRILPVQFIRQRTSPSAGLREHGVSLTATHHTSDGPSELREARRATSFTE